MDRIRKIVPRYSWTMLLAAVILNFTVYFGLPLIRTPEKYYYLGFFLDDWLPVVPIFVTVYFVAYVQWIGGYIMIARENKATCYRVMTGEIIAKIICTLFFIFMPAWIDRPVLEGTDFFTKWLQFTYEIDRPTNLFPSIHCLESYFVVRGALRLKKVPAWYLPVMTVFTVLVFASTVLLKQHYVVDMMGAIAAAEIGLFIAARLPFVKKACAMDKE